MPSLKSVYTSYLHFVHTWNVLKKAFNKNHIESQVHTLVRTLCMALVCGIFRELQRLINILSFKKKESKT